MEACPYCGGDESKCNHRPDTDHCDEAERMYDRQPVICCACGWKGYRGYRINWPACPRCGVSGSEIYFRSLPDECRPVSENFGTLERVQRRRFELTIRGLKDE